MHTPPPEHQTKRDIRKSSRLRSTSSYCSLEQKPLLTIQIFENPSCPKMDDLGHFGPKFPFFFLLVDGHLSAPGVPIIGPLWLLLASRTHQDP
jgi:hypothetical protein